MILAGVLSLTGCGSKHQSASGQIVFGDGTPVKGLAGGTIAFQKAVGEGELSATTPSPSGLIDANGKFTLGTDAVADGAPVGDYRAVISPPTPSGDEQIPKVIDAKHTRFNGNSPVYTVKKGANDFKVIVDPAK